MGYSPSRAISRMDLAELKMRPLPTSLYRIQGSLIQGLLFWLFKGRFKVSFGTVKWYGSSSGTDFDNSEIAGSVIPAFS